MRAILTLLLSIHGLIHLLGFAKAFEIIPINLFSKNIGKPLGVLWLLTGFVFIFSALLFSVKKEYWTAMAFIAVIVSQILIFTVWKDAKFGTLINLLILVAVTISFQTKKFENTFKNNVIVALNLEQASTDLVTEKDLEKLPLVVQKYLRYVGVVGKPKIHNFKLTFEGEMRDKDKKWFKFTSEQYNFFENPTRLFFMKAKVNGLPTNGYHSYQKTGADMNIRILSIASVVHINNQELFTAETVTFFNDLCLFAPAALLNEHIKWNESNELSATATFTAHGKSISAILYFNEMGQLVNFKSNDRYAVSEMKTFPFSTPVSQYISINGFHLPSYGEAIWHYPEGDFVYGKFYLKNVAYNVSTIN